MTPGPPRNQKCQRRGFTLVELLVTCAVMAAAVATLAAMLHGTAESASWHRVLGEVRHLDTAARIRARTDGPVSVRVDAEAHAVRAWLRREASVLATAEIPAGIAAEITVAGGASELAIDGGGRSPDASYVLKGRARTARIGVAGLTGQHAVQEGDSP